MAESMAETRKREIRSLPQYQKMRKSPHQRDTGATLKALTRSKVCTTKRINVILDYNSKYKTNIHESILI